MSLERRHRDMLICYRHTGRLATGRNLDSPPMIKIREMEILILRRYRKFRKDMKKIMHLVDAANRKGGIMEAIEKKATNALAETKKEQARMERLYDDYCTGMLNESDYLELSDRCREQMETKRDALNRVLFEKRKMETRVIEIKTLWEVLDGVVRMTPEKVKEIVETIEVTDEKTIAVRFKHQDTLELFMALVRKKERT